DGREGLPDARAPRVRDHPEPRARRVAARTEGPAIPACRREAVLGLPARRLPALPRGTARVGHLRAHAPGLGRGDDLGGGEDARPDGRRGGLPMSLDLSMYASPREIVEQQFDALKPGTLPIDHWSPSSFDMFRRCPYQWQQRYVKGRRERPAESPVMGTAVHAGVERNYGQKIESHEDLPLAELLDWFMDEGFIRAML